MHAPLALLSAVGTDAGGPDLTRYFAVCAILVLAILGLAYGFRRLIAGAVRAKAAGRSLQVLDVLPLGNKQRLAVVRCYDRTFALGLGEREVSLVAELDPVHGELRPAAPASTADAHDFARALDGARPAPPGRRRIQDLFRSGSVVG